LIAFLATERNYANSTILTKIRLLTQVCSLSGLVFPARNYMGCLLRRFPASTAQPPEAIASSYLKFVLQQGGKGATLLALCIALGGCRFETALQARQGDVQLSAIKGIHYKTGIVPNTPVLYPFPMLPLLHNLLLELIFPEDLTLQWNKRPKLFQSKQYAVEARRARIGARLLRRWALFHVAAIPQIPFSATEIVAFAANHACKQTQRNYIRVIEPLAICIQQQLSTVLTEAPTWQPNTMSLWSGVS